MFSGYPQVMPDSEELEKTQQLIDEAKKLAAEVSEGPGAGDLLAVGEDPGDADARGDDEPSGPAADR
ncbi:hypothetical protein Lesp02_47630 [Lentzea sp. NBRC 105346]|nr:hypothetical protein Lesp02_47630 [Lentzea sp. NBRC 105346]